MYGVVCSLPGHGLDGLAVLVARLHAPPPAAVDGLGGGGGHAPEEGEQLHDGLLAGDDVERVELDADELQLFLLILAFQSSSFVVDVQSLLRGHGRGPRDRQQHKRPQGDLQ